MDSPRLDLARIAKDLNDWHCACGRQGQPGQMHTTPSDECRICPWCENVVGLVWPPVGMKGAHPLRQTVMDLLAYAQRLEAEREARRVLFLDIDDVLNDGAFRAQALAGRGAIVSFSVEVAAATLDPVRVARIQSLDSVGALFVVVASGWRQWATLGEIASALRRAGLTLPVLGCLGGIKMSGEILRARALREWLAEHPWVTHWAVLDDSRHLYCPTGDALPAWLKDRLVLPTGGVTEEDITRTRGALLRPAPTLPTGDTDV